MLAIIVFPVYVLVLIILWTSYLRQCQTSGAKPSALVPITAAVLGTVVGYMTCQNLDWFGYEGSLSLDGVAGAAAVAPVMAVFGGKIALWLLARATR